MAFDPDKLPDPDFMVPDITKAVEGWRVWKTSVELPRFWALPKLYSASERDYYWAPRKASLAFCKSCGDDVPGESCRCGFYSAKTLKHLLQMPYPKYNVSVGEVKVLGRVANWGKVIVATTGWRAAKSYPVKLWVPYEAWRLAAPLEEAYGVPVGLRNWLSSVRSVG